MRSSTYFQSRHHSESCPIPPPPSQRGRCSNDLIKQPVSTPPPPPPGAGPPRLHRQCILASSLHVDEGSLHVQYVVVCLVLLARVLDCGLPGGEVTTCVLDLQPRSPPTPLQTRVSAACRRCLSRRLHAQYIAVCLLLLAHVFYSDLPRGEVTACVLGLRYPTVCLDFGAAAHPASSAP